MDPTFKAFEPCMDQLDALIAQLENNLGKNKSKSPFDAIRQKYGGAKEEEKQPAAPEEAKKPADQPKKETKEKKPKGGNKPEPAPASNLSQELEWFNGCDLRVGKIV